MLLLTLSQIWLLGAPSPWLLCLFSMLPSFREHFLTFWQHFCAPTFMSILSPISLGPLIGEWYIFRNQDLGTRFAPDSCAHSFF